MKVNCEKTERGSGMKKLLCTIQDTSHMIQIKKRLDQNHINYSVEPIKSNFFSDLVHMIFYRTVVSGIEHKNETTCIYVLEKDFDAAKKAIVNYRETVRKSL